MRWATLFTLLCVATCIPTMYAVGADATDLQFLTSDGRILTRASALDDPQPDTLSYDNGSVQSFFSTANHWARVRFTAPTTFEVRSIYFVTNNPAANATPCSLFVHADNGGEIGAVLGQAVVSPVAPLGDFNNPTWNDVNLDVPTTIAEGDDFFVVAGPAPGGPQSAGWHIILDNSPTGRSAIGTAGHYGSYSSGGVSDWLLRVGGGGEPFVDLSATQCYSETNAGDNLFFIQAGEELTYKAQIENIGNTVVDDFLVSWSVTGPGGSEVFTDNVLIDQLGLNGIVQVSGTMPFMHTEEGEYLVTCAVTANDDAAPDNDITYLRYFVQYRDVWFRYDDGEPDGFSSFVPDNGWGVSFTPSEYPAAVESIRVNLGGNGNANFSLFIHEQDQLPEAAAVWADCVAVTQGWTTFAINPPLQVFEGNSILLRYLYSGMSMGRDDTPPNAAGISNMGVVAFSSQAGTWTTDNAGNWCMQMYLAETSAVPPWPVLEVSVEELIFGDVPINQTAEMTYWVYNRGAEDALNVTEVTLIPPSIRTIYAFEPPTFSVAAGDSQEVTVSFSPEIVDRDYNGLVTIANNSNNEPSFQMIIRGTGDEASAADDAAAGLPTEFALSQNYPNPFNPATEIQFALPVASDVKITVMNLLGQTVGTVASGVFAAGYHTVSFHAASLPSGLYLYRLETGSFSATRKMMLLK